MTESGDEAVRITDITDLPRDPLADMVDTLRIKVETLREWRELGQVTIHAYQGLQDEVVVLSAEITLEMAKRLADLR